MNKIISLTVIYLSLLLITNHSYAGVDKQMKDFLGANSNYSEGGRYESQSRGYFSSPSLYSRNAILEVKPVNITMPSFRAGCGGIDMFAGSFSHINSDQFIALLKAIPSNALGYAFQLAIETISPSLADTMNKMEDIMRSINSATLNSCELGKNIVNSAASKFEKGAEIVCVRQQMERGLADDIAEAKKNCTSGGQKTSTLASSNESQDAAVVDINYAWNAISKLTSDKELKEFIQTITGTIIIEKGANDNSPPSIKTYPSLATDDMTLDALLYGGAMKKYTCDDDVKCLSINGSSTQNIAKGSAFHDRIKTTLSSVANKMKVRNQELTDEEGELLSVTDVPVVAILRTYQRYYSGQIDSMVSDSLSEMVAHDLLNNFMGNLLLKIGKVSKQNNVQVDESKLKEFQESIKDTQFVLSQKEFKMQKKRDQLLNEVNRAHKIEKEANSIFVGRMYDQIN